MSTLDALRFCWEQGFDELKRRSLWRREQLAPVDPSCDFSSNDTLGLRNEAALAEAAYAAARRYGVGAGASRAVLRFDPALEAFEHDFSAWLGVEAGMLFPSGFTANMALLQALPATAGAASLDLSYFVDHRAHASLIQGARCSGRPVVYFRHADYAHLREQIARHPCAHPVAVVEALHSMDGTWEDAAALAAVASETGCALVIDEAHSVGIAGPGGRGWTTAHPELAPHCLARMVGLGKAFGVQGGFIAGSGALREQLVQFAGPFLFSTGMSPLIVGALDAAWRMVAGAEGEVRRARLLELRGLWERETGAPAPSPVVPWLVGESEAALRHAERLAQAGFFVRAIRPPTVPRGTARLRVVLRSPQPDAAVRALARLLREG